MQDLLREALALHRQGRLDEARQRYEQLLARQPQHFDALHLLGVVRHQQGDPEAAVGCIRRALALKPDHASALCNLGNSLGQLGDVAGSLAAYDQALALNPKLAEAHHNRGIALQNLGRHPEALPAFAEAAALKPGYLQAHLHLGASLLDVGRVSEAVHSYRQALALRPDDVEILGALAGALFRLRDYAAASPLFDAALALQPESTRLLCGRALLRLRTHRPMAAVEDLRRVLAREPAHKEALCHLGVCLLEMNQPEESLSLQARVLMLDPRHVPAHINHGNALRLLRRLPEAAASFERAIALQPDHADAWANLGNIWIELRRPAQAVRAFEKALALNPHQSFLAGVLQNNRMAICDWAGWDEKLASLFRQVRDGWPASPSFPLLALTDDEALHRRAAETWVRLKCKVERPLPEPGPRARSERIRIGYFSADFHEHATVWLAAGLWEAHDRGRFELFAYSFGPDKQDLGRRRVLDAFDHFHDVRGRAFADVAALARSHGLDIAVDLKGATQDSLQAIFAYRLAPVQVSFLGYPGTTGARFMDYVVGDRTVLPRENWEHYTEQPVWLPDTYQPNDRRRPPAAHPPARADLGLADDAFVFCCFNNNYKIGPATFDGWMRILRQVEGSVLWLLRDNDAAADNLRHAAAGRGVDPARLVFAPRARFDAHIARQAAADLFLDTLPYTAHTTASDAIWAGLPVLTCTGRSFASRVSASVLQAAGLPDLVAADPAAFEALAVALARDPKWLAGIRERVKEARCVSALFDAPRYTRHLEAAYQAMHQRSLRGEPPSPLLVTA